MVTNESISNIGTVTIICSKILKFNVHFSKQKLKSTSDIFFIWPMWAGFICYSRKKQKFLHTLLHLYLLPPVCPHSVLSYCKL